LYDNIYEDIQTENDFYQPERYAFNSKGTTSAAIGKHVQCLWWTRGKYHVSELVNGVQQVWRFERAIDQAVQAFDAVQPDECVSTPLTYSALSGDFDLNALTQPVTLLGLQRQALHLSRQSPSLTVPAPDFQQIQGILIHEGVAGTKVQFEHAPWVVAVNHPRAFSVPTSEACGLKCETTYGCTSFLFQGGGSGQTNHYCWLFHFDPSTTGCEIFDAVDTSAFPEGVDRGATPAHLPLGLCESDCDSDTDCAGTLRCFERDNNEPVPGCRTGTISATHDFCYDPFQSAVAAIRRPDACRLCKSRGLLPVTDIARLGFMVGPNQRQRGRGVECYTQAYSPARDTAETWVAQSCRLFPYDGSWTADPGTVLHRCPPTRAGLATRFQSTEQVLGMRFASDSSVLLRLDGHPDIASAVECELACMHTPQCRAWDYLYQGYDIYNYYRFSGTTTPAETTEHYTQRKEDSYTVLTASTDRCEGSYRPLGVVECGETAASNPWGIEGGLQSGVMKASTRTDIPFGCTLYRKDESDARVFYRTPQQGTDYPKNTHLPVCAKLSDALGAVCQRCDPQSPYEQCQNPYDANTLSAATLVCRTATIMNPLAPCSDVEMGASYCVPASPHAHTCTLFANVPALVVKDQAGYWNGNRVGIVRRAAGTPKPAFFDDGTHPACLCYDETDTSYGCNCDPASFAPFPDAPSDDTWGCSGHGQCASLSYQCHCDEGYGWMWQDAQNGHASGFTCVACPAGTFKNSELDVCTPCSHNTYQDTTGSTACHACPQDKTTLQTGSTSADLCV
jgi:hypothetical protein